MPDAEANPEWKPIGNGRAAVFALAAAVCFHAAYTPSRSGPLAGLIVGYAVFVIQLARMRTPRRSFYAALLTGLACYGPQLECFWRIFGAAAVPLWMILAVWLALFVLLAHLAIRRFGPRRAMWLLPFLWTGLEYFRSELYYLRFSWLNPGYAFSDWPAVPFELLGVYGVGFVLVMGAASCLAGWKRSCLLLGAIVVLFGYFSFPSSVPERKGPPPLRIAGVQLEFPDPERIEKALNDLVTEDPGVNLIVLSEYTLDDPPSKRLKDWCRTQGKFLVVGGKDPAEGQAFYNTAFVIDTNGAVVFKQAKSVPIQFFKDGLPAREQAIWTSPWGVIGICICYDLSYTRVSDRLVRLGAELLIVPTMDVVDWGRHQHELHARIAPVRAAEYQVPIFRLASSGISQAVSSAGFVRSEAPFAGEGQKVLFDVRLRRGKRSLPLDRIVAPLCVAVTGGFVLFLVVDFRRRLRLDRA